MAIFAIFLPKEYMVYAFIFWGSLWVINSQFIVRKECPFCGKKYFKTFLGYNIWKFKCASCKKSIYDD